MRQLKSIWQTLPFDRLGSNLPCESPQTAALEKGTGHIKQTAPNVHLHANTGYLSHSLSQLLGGLKHVAVGSALLFALTPTAQADITDIFAVAKLWSGGSSNHSCVTLPDGGAKCWGRNDKGQLGNASQADSLVPVDVYGLPSTIVDEFGNPITIYGTPTTHGFNDITFNEYGNPVTVYDDFGNPVTAYGSPITSVSAYEITLGEAHACALTSIGGVKCWGTNSSGQLGNDSTEDSAVPVDVMGLTYGAKSVATGRYNSCAVLEDGTVQCWGYNKHGELGNGEQTNSPVPVEVNDLTDVRMLAMGRFHACALVDEDGDGEGGVKCWGLGGNGQLGNGKTVSSKTPVDVVNLASGVQAIAAGAWHSCALKTDGSVLCWGRNRMGQVGDNTTKSKKVPTLLNTLNDVTMLALGEMHSCALTGSGEVKCWGSNGVGQLGIDASQANSLVPVTVAGLTASAVAVGRAHSCALTAGDGVKCWGDNFYGQLGNASNVNSDTPVTVMGTSENAVAGGLHAKLKLSFIAKQGEVEVAPIGASCGEDCYDLGPAPAEVSLTAMANAGFKFLGWRRDCSGSQAEDYTLTVAGSASCLAAFNALPLDYVLQVQFEGGEGTVSVTPDGDNCGTDCYDFGQSATEVDVTVTPDTGYAFLNWTGACSGNSPTATVLVDSANVNCVAVFEQVMTDGVAAYFIPSPNSSMSATFIKVINDGDEATAVRGTLYNQAGEVVGSANTVLTEELASKATLTLSSYNLSTTFGEWSEFAWLEITEPVRDVTLLNYARTPNATIRNFSIASDGYAAPLMDLTSPHVNQILVINRHNKPANLVATVINEQGRVIAVGVVSQGNIAPRAIQVLTVSSLQSRLDVSWTGYTRLLLTDINNPGGNTIKLLNTVLSTETDDVTNLNQAGSNIIYDIKPSDSEDSTQIHLTNIGDTTVQVKGIRYEPSISTAYHNGQADAAELVGALAPQTTVTLDALDVEQALGSWDGYKPQLLITQPTSDLEIVATTESNGALSDSITVSDHAAYYLPNAYAVDKAWVQITNTTANEVNVYATLYNRFGNVLGDANTEIMNGLEGYAVLKLSMSDLKDLFGTNWPGKARLEITSPQSGIDVMTQLRSPNGFMSNMSGVQTQ